MKTNHYHCLVVSRERQTEDPGESDESVLVREDDQNKGTVLKKVCPETAEIRLYCHSESKAKKEQAVRNRFHDREEALNKLNDGLNKKGTVKKYEKIIERIGRLIEKHNIVSQDYTITVIPDEHKKEAIAIEWQRNPKSNDKDRNCGVYCLRTNIQDWAEQVMGNLVHVNRNRSDIPVTQIGTRITSGVPSKRGSSHRTSFYKHASLSLGSYLTVPVKAE
ncbi:MAG: hypothetical protein ACREVA_10565 [Burkholderiales bacterium]